MDLKSMGRDSRIGPASASCFTSRSWRTEGGGEEEDESQRRVRQVASSEGVVDDLATTPAGKTGSASTTATRSGELREASPPLLRTVAHREKQEEERERD